MTPFRNQIGAIPLIVLISLIAVVSIVIITSTFSFRNKLFSGLYPKSSSYANQPKLLFINDQGSIISATTTARVKIQIHSQWPPISQSIPTTSPSSTPISSQLTTSPVPTATNSLVYTRSIDISEDPNFPLGRTISYPYVNCSNLVLENCIDNSSNNLITTFIFSGSELGTKTLCVRFNPTTDLIPDAICSSINLIELIVPTNTPEATNTPLPTREQFTDQPRATDAPLPDSTEPVYPTNAPVATQTTFKNQQRLQQSTEEVIPNTPQPTINKYLIATPNLHLEPDPKSLSKVENSTEPFQFVRPDEKSNSNENIINKGSKSVTKEIQSFFSDIINALLSIFGQ